MTTILTRQVEIFRRRRYFVDVIRQLALVMLWAWVVTSPTAAQGPGSPLWLTVYFHERPPFTMVDGQTGILVNLTKAILSEAGLHARFIELPTNRILSLVRNGEPDAVGVGWFLTQERESWGRYSLPIYQDQPLVAVVSSRVASSLGNPVRLNVLLSSGLALGHQQGSSFGPVVDAKIRTLGLVPVETVVEIPSLLQLIHAGKMDYTFLPEEEARYLLKRDPTLTPGLVLTKLADAPPGNLRYLLFPATVDPALLTRIDSAIERIRNSVRYMDLTMVE